MINNPKKLLPIALISFLINITCLFYILKIAPDGMHLEKNEFNKDPLIQIVFIIGVTSALMFSAASINLLSIIHKNEEI